MLTISETLKIKPDPTKNPLGNGVNNPKHFKPDNQTQIIEFNK